MIREPGFYWVCTNENEKPFIAELTKSVDGTYFWWITGNSWIVKDEYIKVLSSRLEEPHE